MKTANPMPSTVTVPFPINLKNENRHLYASRLTFEVAPLKVKRLKNIFVSFTGFCMNKNGLIKESHHDYANQLKDYQSEVSYYYYNALDHPGNLIELDGSHTYLVIHHPWFNYYHWICESIFRLWSVRDKLDELILVLPEHYKNADFIMGSLEPFGVKNIYFIPDGKSLWVESLCLPQIKPICDSYSATELKQVSSFIRNYVRNSKKIFSQKRPKLYVSRELAGRRKVINEEAVQEVVKKYGFAVFCPEEHSFLEQVAIFSEVRYLIGTHGSGLTNLLFMESGAALLELHQKNTNELDYPSPLFWYMAECLKINYYHQICQTSGKEDYFEGDYYIDPVSLESNIRIMLGL
ncbi:DUF563 domain-containing protein [Mucilaginibacter sp. Mucisp86]|uniref:glycosyltransferase family 61 protein n=1 Tax=Mucilaginibacter sp. Mucisp86 TaxID=3243060 RepID=UPI0039B651CE